MTKEKCINQIVVNNRRWDFKGCKKLKVRKKTTHEAIKTGKKQKGIKIPPSN